MTKERRKRNPFVTVLIYLGMVVLGMFEAAIITFMILVFVHLFITERPPFVMNKMWRSMFFQKVDWTVAAVIWRFYLWELKF